MQKNRLRVTSSDFIFATKALVDNQKKKFVKSNIFSVCPQNMVNFSQLALEFS